MSDMDGVSGCDGHCRSGAPMGTQSRLQSRIMVWYMEFTDANHYIERLDKDDPFKIIYGVEAYLVDDLKEVGDQ